MSKVLHLSTSLKTKGGISTVISEYINSEFWQKWNCRLIETHIDKSKSIKLLFFLRSFFVFLINIINTDIVHIHFSEPTSAKRKLFFFVLSWLLKKKRIAHFHAFNNDSTINSYPFLYYILFLISDKIIVLSDKWRIWIIEKWPNFGNKISIIYNPIKINYDNIIDSKKKNQILFTGVLNKRKGYEDLIKAFYIVIKKQKNWTLIIAGDGELKHAKELVTQLKLINNVTFVGWVSGETKNKLYKESKIFCLPSYAEGFPMSIIEACNFGNAIICTNVGGISDLLENYKNAIIINPGDIDKLAMSMEKLMNDESLRINLGQSAHVLANRYFNIKNITLQLNNIYSDLLNK